MVEDARPSSRLAFVAVLLVVLGVALWLAYRVTAGNENHAFAPNAIPRDYVAVTVNRTYELSFPGGVRGMQAQGLSPDSLSCTWSSTNGVNNALAVDGFGSGVASRNGVATFQAPTNGRIHVTCNSLGTMFIDDADDASGDPSGWLLIGSTLALTVGAAVTMSVLRGTPRRPKTPEDAEPHHATWTAGEDDEVRRLVRMVRQRADEDDAKDAGS